MTPQLSIGLTAQVVSAFVGRNNVGASEIGGLIASVHKTLAELGAHPVEAAPLVPAVDPKKSVFPEYIICLEDGKRYRSLKRHLRAAYGMSADEYRRRWNLPATYPMAAPGFSKARSEVAKAMGLGTGGRGGNRGKR